MGCARTATPSAPLSRDIPWPAHSFSTFAQKLSVGPESREGARKWRFLGGKPLLVPHGGARTLGRGAHPHRGAALDARLAGLCALPSVCYLRVPQARLRHVLGVCASTWDLSTPTLRATHDDVRQGARRRRGEERGRHARAMRTRRVHAKSCGTSGSRTRVYVRVW